MRSINAFANQQPKSFASVVTAQRALDKAIDAIAPIDDAPIGTWLDGATLIVERTTDQRFAIIIVNPNHVSFWLSFGFGVFGISQGVA